MKKVMAVIGLIGVMAVSVVAGGGVDESYLDYMRKQNVPRNFHNKFYNAGLLDKFDYNFVLNPFYLRGDFNGDGKNDLAVAIRDIKTEKTGIAINHSGSEEFFIIGADSTSLGNGGNDFHWMGIWTIKTGIVGKGADEGEPPVLIGEAILATKPESASAIIYWDGEKYKWYQQGD